MRREIDLVPGSYYHVFNKSIDGCRIFNHPQEFKRMLGLIRYYQVANVDHSFSELKNQCEVRKLGLTPYLLALSRRNEKRANILAYCLMPTHVHFILEAQKENGIAEFMRLIQSSYACYFNLKYKRSGPVWTGRFKAVLVEGEAQFLHLTRYIHLNPATAYLVEDPADWAYSSYQEYLCPTSKGAIADVGKGRMDMSIEEYKDFVLSQKDYQREVKLIEKQHRVLTPGVA